MQFPCFPPQHHSPQKMNSTEDDLPPPPPELTRQPEVVAPVNDRPTVSVHTVHRAPPLSSATYEKELPPPVSLRSVVRLCFFFSSLLSVWCLCRILPPTPLPPPHSPTPYSVVSWCFTLWLFKCDASVSFTFWVWQICRVLPLPTSRELWCFIFGCDVSVGYWSQVERCDLEFYLWVWHIC